jgi:hypothetical protein
MIVLPVTITSITAVKQDNNIAVQWKVQNELNLAGYEVERAADGIHFTKMADLSATNSSSNTYNWVDINTVTGINYYRIKMIDRNGQFKYSTIVQVMITQKGTVSIYPNPIENNTVQLLMAGLVKGKYQINLSNSNGQLISNHSIDYNGTDAVKAIPLTTLLPKGIYNAEINGPLNKKVTIQFLVQ